ncbi:MAG TPA: hypothetical protein VF867_18690 [Arthrobacter sp.]
MESSTGPDALPEAAARRLAALHKAAAAGGKAAGSYENALRAFKEAGWTWRQIGDAVGLSHEAVRNRAARPPVEGARVLPRFSIPGRVRPLEIIQVPALPKTIAADLTKHLAAAIGENGAGDAGVRTATGLRPAVADFFAALQAARDAGWDNYAIGPAIGLHPRAVSRFTARHPDTGRTHRSYPAAPEGTREVLARARRPQVPAVAIPAGDAALMQADDEAGVLLGRWYLYGASRDALAAAVGQDWETVRKRLVRLGFMTGGR